MGCAWWSTVEETPSPAKFMPVRRSASSERTCNTVLVRLENFTHGVPKRNPPRLGMPEQETQGLPVHASASRAWASVTLRLGRSTWTTTSEASSLSTSVPSGR